MRAKRLRPAYTDDEMVRVYPKPHEAGLWVDHRARVNITVTLAHMFDYGAKSGADLSCGDGMILQNIALQERHFGDFAPGYQYYGPIEKTIHEIPPVNLFVCTETIEHLDNPDDLLVEIGRKADRLILSTPIDAWDDPNHEHYWAWDREYVEAMIREAGYRLLFFNALDFRLGNPASYCFGIWGCMK